MEKRESPVWVYDFTASCDKIALDDIKTLLIKHCKKWTFQQELAESGYLHYQGRISLKEKLRINQVIKLFGHSIHWSITSTTNKSNTFYVEKSETNVAGPWSDTDEVIYIPRQIREIEKLYAWQEKIIELSKEWDTRSIHCIIDSEGNNGKSTLVQYMRAHKLGRKIPFCNDYKDVLRMVMDMPTSNCYIIDIPRAINKDKLYQLWGAIEEIKSGYAYDDRYSFKEKVFDSPQIFVFTNILPDLTLLSADRWKLWRIYKEDLKRIKKGSSAIQVAEELLYT